jgi:hypothetical protein
MMEPETDSNTTFQIEDKDNQNWIQYYWRPIMAWQYAFICLFDFVIAPILTAFFSLFAGIPYVPWTPLTLGEGGFYHMSMGAIIGVTAWTRGQEKVQKIRRGIYDPYEIVESLNTYNHTENTPVDSENGSEESASQVPVDRPLMRRRR